MSLEMHHPYYDWRSTREDTKSILLVPICHLALEERIARIGWQSTRNCAKLIKIATSSTNPSALMILGCFEGRMSCCVIQFANWEKQSNKRVLRSSHKQGNAQLPWPVPWIGVLSVCWYVLESPVAVQILKTICSKVLAWKEQNWSVIVPRPIVLAR